jgi:hypothetical protein
MLKAYFMQCAILCIVLYCCTSDNLKAIYICCVSLYAGCVCSGSACERNRGAEPQQDGTGTVLSVCLRPQHWHYGRGSNHSRSSIALSNSHLHDDGLDIIYGTALIVLPAEACTLNDKYRIMQAYVHVKHFELALAALLLLHLFECTIV